MAPCGSEPRYSEKSIVKVMVEDCTCGEFDQIGDTIERGTNQFSFCRIRDLKIQKGRK